MEIRTELESLNFAELELQELYQEGQSFEDFQESVLDEILYTEIIYYSRAFEYLKENDISLKESMSIAYEMGYTLQDINSETLATLLYQETLKNDWYLIADKVEELFEQIEY